MKLTDVVKQHGFEPSELAEIKDAKLYQRINADGISEILCVQRIGNVMRINRIALLIGSGMVLPLSEPINQILPTEKVEDYLNKTLAPANVA